MIKSIAKALDILELLSVNETRKIGLAEIASSMGMNKGTCANILKTLRERGYVEQAEYRSDYQIGYKLYQLTGRNIENSDLTKMARHDIESLGRSLNETAIFSVIRNDRRVVLYGTVPDREMVVRTNIDKSVYATYTGRTIIANYAPEHLDKFILRVGLPSPEDWPEIYQHENPRGALINALISIKRQGYLVGHNTYGVVGFASPVFEDNHVVGAVGVYMPEIRVTDEMFVLGKVLKCAEDINRKLNVK